MTRFVFPVVVTRLNNSFDAIIFRSQLATVDANAGSLPAGFESNIVGLRVIAAGFDLCLIFRRNDARPSDPGDVRKRSSAFYPFVERPSSVFAATRLQTY